MMRRTYLSLSLALCLGASFISALGHLYAADATDSVLYQGAWHTTNRKLDGTMTCVVTRQADEHWQGRFFGTWQGVSFNYTVPFAGPMSDLRGTANIDGADYQWTGKISSGSPGTFKGTFGGSRYNGFFDLKETQRTAAEPKTSGQ